MRSTDYYRKQKSVIELHSISIKTHTLTISLKASSNYFFLTFFLNFKEGLKLYLFCLFWF